MAYYRFAQYRDWETVPALEQAMGVKVTKHGVRATASDIRKIKEPSNLMDFLLECTEFDCTDPRDRIFSILSLGMDVKITPDYTQYWMQLCRRVAEIYLVEEQDLNILHHVGASRKLHENNEPAWPSYVPDWSRESRPNALAGYWTPENWTFGSRKTGAPFVSTSPSGNITVRGRQLDCILFSVSNSEFSVGDSDVDILTQIKVWMKVYGNVRTNTAAYLTGEETFTAMAKTLIADNKLSATQSLLAGFTIEQCALDLENWILDRVIVRNVTEPFRKSVKAVMEHRSLIITLGYKFIGTTACEVQCGDVLCLLGGAETPFLLRPVADQSRKCFYLVGECYIQGLMDDREYTLGALPEEHFELV